MDPGFEEVAAAFADAHRDEPGGAGLCVYLDGRRRLDLVHGAGWSASSCIVLRSASKGVLALCLAMLVEDGLLDVRSPVARYWPEFARNGKGAITVEQVLTHSAGLADVVPPPAGLADWGRCVAQLEDAAATPDAGVVYHAVSFGFLAGEVLRRITGSGVGTFVAERIAGPLGLELWLGLPAERETAVAPLLLPEPDERSGEDALLARMEFFGTRAGRACEVPSSNAVGTAAALARMYAATIGRVDGVRLVGDATVERIRTPRVPGIGLGFQLAQPGLPMLGDGCFGHSGAGGVLAFAHPESGLAVGYTCSRLSLAQPEPRWGWLEPLARLARRSGVARAVVARAHPVMPAEVP